MIQFDRDKMEASLQDLLKADKKTKKSILPTVKEDDVVETIIETALEHPRKKSIYVVDKNNALVGIITIRTLMRNLFFSYHKPQAHSRRIIKQITDETADEIMHTDYFYAKYNGMVEETLHYMIKSGVYAIPVVDDNNQVLHELSMRDILRFLYTKARK